MVTFMMMQSPLESYYYLSQIPLRAGKDHLGSVRMTVDAGGNVAGYDDYYPFGGIMPGRSSNSGLADSKYKFTGKERDVETSLDYFGARYYDSWRGQWLSVDPMAGKYPGLSPYCYVADNPVKFFDPDGKRIRFSPDRNERQIAYSLISSLLTKDERSHVGVKYDREKGEFRMVSLKGYEGTSRAFAYLREVINSPEYVDVKISRTVETKYGLQDVTKDYGGGVTQLKEDGSSTVTVSPNGTPLDPSVNPLNIIMGHELLGHARLNQKGDPAAKDEGPSIKIENEIRKELGLPPKEESLIFIIPGPISTPDQKKDR